MISPDDIKKLAMLARINLSTEEEQSLAIDMDSILGYVEQIKNVTATSSDPHDPAASKHAADQKEKTRNVFRDDTNPHQSGQYTEAILAEAPERDGQYVKVKKIL